MLSAREYLAAAVAESNARFDAEESIQNQDIAGQLAALAGRIAKARASTIEMIISIGEWLLEAQQLLAGTGRDGKFQPWITEQCGFSTSSAYNYIRVFQAFGDKCATVGHLFDAKAVYLLSSKNCPEAATEKAVNLAKSGEHVTHKIAKDIIAEFSDNEASNTNPALTEDDTFDLEAAESKPRDYVRESASRWPTEHQGRLSALLQELAREVLAT